MKYYKNFKKSKLLLILLLTLIVGASPAWGDELTVANGETTNSNTPFDAGNADYGIKGEYIIPAADLAAMNGMAIKSIKLYAYTNNTSSKPNYGPFQVFMKEVENATPYSQSSSAFQGMDGATIVYEGTVVVSSKEMLITFTSDYEYHGGNLLIGFYKDKGGNYYSNKFYGVNQDGYTGCSSYSSSGLSYITTGTGRSFIPKTTFTYEAISQYKKPATLTYTSVTSNSAVINWTAGSGDSSETGWDLEYKTSASDTWTEVHGLGASTLTYSLTSLEANTSYDVRVKAIYSGGESDWKDVTFKTEKISTPASGFTDNFETDKGWDLINGTQTNKWVRGSATNNGGSNALYISNDGGTTNAYSHTASMTFATKLFAFEAGDFTISYDWKANGESTYDYLRVALVPASVELTAGTTPSGFAANTLPTGWQALDGGSKLNLQSDWQNKSVDKTIESAGLYQVVFAWKNDGSGGTTTPAAAIDNFKILGASPVIELGGDVVGATLAFGSVAETTNKTIRITNAGKVAMENIVLTETADEDNAFAYAALPKTTLEANEYMDVTATFSGSSLKDYTGSFQISADDCDPIEVTVTATYSNNPATMAVTLDEVAVGDAVAFGSVGKQAQKTFTVTNSGDQTLHITSIASNNTTDFTVSPATLEVAGHSSETFTVTFVYDAEALDAEKIATITVTASNEGIEAKSFTVTGTRIDQWSEDFSGGTLSEGWTNPISGYTAWTISDGTAYGNYANYKDAFMQSPLLRVEEGQSLTFLAKGSISSSDLFVYAVTKNGTTAKTYDFSSVVSANYNSDYSVVTVDGLDEGSYYLQFKSYKSYIKQIEGFKLDLNDPKMGIYSDAECTAAVATSVTKDFGFATTNQTVSYYIKNDGTGTMTLSKGDDPAGFTATLDKTSVAAGEHATLTITMPAADNAGYHSGNIVVTATDLGTFTVAANGVIRDEDKLYLDFSSANIPAAWTASNWTKNGAGYIENSTYSSGSIETAILTAEAGEDVVIEAKMFTSSYTFGVNYKKQGDAEWSTLIEAANVGTEWTKLRATIAEAGKYQLQFVGTRAQIRHIYGLAELNEPVMVVYDSEEVAGSTHNFGNVSDEDDATWTLTVKNEGKATLTGLAAALSGTNAAHYSVEVSATELAVNATTIITVKQLKDNIGAHSATLTISADDLDSKEIALSGFTYNHNKLFVDFESGSFPAGWTTNSWTVATTSGNQHARAGYTASSLITTPLIVGEDESLVFKAKRQYSSSAPTFQIRYTTNGGVTWSEYADYASQVTSGDFTNITLSGISAGTAIVEIYGRYVDLDDFYGFAPTTAPVLSLTESAVAVASGSTKEFGNLTEAGTATYTLSNTGTANLVSTVATTGVATAAISGEGEGVTIAENTVTLEPGKSATITLTLPYVAPYGEKAGAMTISSQGWVADMVINYTATTIDPTALYVDFNDNTKPAGWYQEASGWTISAGRAHVYTGVTKALVTEQYAAEEGKNVLRFDAKKQSNYADGELKVYTSTDRKTWTLAKTVTLTNEDQQVALDALADDNYYVKFESLNASIDNLTGLKRILPAPEHDLYVSTSDIPTATKVPESSITATATVYSLRADETGVYAKLFFDEELVATTAESQDISNGYSANFTLTGNVPATEKTYAAKIVVYYSDNSVAFETLTTNVEVAHTRTLSITSFTRNGEGDIDANASNQFSAAFNVTVQNTGSIAATPVVKIFIGETEVGSATADAEVAAGESKEIAVNVNNASAGEGGNLSFTAKAYWTAEGEVKATSASDVIIKVNAAAPKFVLNIKGGAEVSDGDNVEFGLVKEATTKTYTITNSGTAPLELISIVAPTGYTATEVTAGNKTIAIDGTLDIDVTLNAEQGKKSGNLVFTYKVDAMTNNTFTLALSGRSVAADTWTEAFDDYQASIPANWTNNKWSIAGEYNDYPGAVYSNYNDATLISPRLTAEAGEELTFDVKNNYYKTATYAIFSASSNTWSDEETISGTGEITFTAPAAGDYYLRLTGRGAYIQNFVGFKLATTVPVTVSQYGLTTFASLSKLNLDDLPDNLEAYYVASDGINAEYVRITPATGNVPAGTGLILKGTANESYNIKIATDAATALEGNLMVGCVVNTPLDADANSYVMVNNTAKEKAEFQSLANYGITILAGKAYLKAAGGGARLSIVFDDEDATGIMSLLRQQAKDGRVYNLNGQRVENPKKGQLYIINGKQTVIK